MDDEYWQQVFIVIYISCLGMSVTHYITGQVA